MFTNENFLKIHLAYIDIYKKAEQEINGSAAALEQLLDLPSYQDGINCIKEAPKEAKLNVSQYVKLIKFLCTKECREWLDAKNADQPCSSFVRATWELLIDNEWRFTHEDKKYLTTLTAEGIITTEKDYEPWIREPMKYKENIPRRQNIDYLRKANKLDKAHYDSVINTSYYVGDVMEFLNTHYNKKNSNSFELFKLAAASPFGEINAALLKWSKSTHYQLNWHEIKAIISCNQPMMLVNIMLHLILGSAGKTIENRLTFFPINDLAKKNNLPELAVACDVLLQNSTFMSISENYFDLLKDSTDPESMAHCLIILQKIPQPFLSFFSNDAALIQTALDKLKIHNNPGKLLISLKESKNAKSLDLKTFIAICDATSPAAQSQEKPAPKLLPISNDSKPALQPSNTSEVSADKLQATLSTLALYYPDKSVPENAVNWAKQVAGEINSAPARGLCVYIYIHGLATAENINKINHHANPQEFQNKLIADRKVAKSQHPKKPFTQADFDAAYNATSTPPSVAPPPVTTLSFTQAL